MALYDYIYEIKKFRKNHPELCSQIKSDIQLQAFLTRLNLGEKISK